MSNTLSRRVTCSCGRKSDNNQKARQAPNIRYAVTALAETTAKASFPIGAFSPQMILAANNATWPFHE